MKKTEKAITYLGRNTEWKGKLTFNGSIRIDGHFIGDISSKGTLLISEEGFIEGNIHVSYIVISGEVHGEIIADQRVDIHAPGKVFGNIQAPTVVMDQGVIFEGTTRMYRAKKKDTEESALIGADQYTGGPPPNLTAIHGIVTDQKTGNPVKNALVKCKGDGSHATNTNSSGYYELVNLDDGKWKLKIGAKGYKKERATVEISGGGTFEQNIELIPKNE